MGHKVKEENGNMIEMGLVIVGIVVALILIIMAFTGKNSGATPEEQAVRAVMEASDSAAEKAVNTQKQMQADQIKDKITLETTSIVQKYYEKYVATNQKDKPSAKQYVLQELNAMDKTGDFEYMEIEDEKIIIYSDKEKTQKAYEGTMDDSGSITWK